jgi:hypothetical protein
MTVQLKNFEFSYKGPKEKRVFVPSAEGRAVGNEVKKLVESTVFFESHYFHLTPGGHISALHAHREHEFFAKLDLENFFYSIGRNRVARALRKHSIRRAEHLARWSTVKNPAAPPSYALPYGFVQSPILATLVLRESELGCQINRLSQQLELSVFLDDICVSSNDESIVNAAFHALIQSAESAKFKVNGKKVSGPSRKITLFNCSLEYMQSAVLQERREKFYSTERSVASAEAFERYCSIVESRRWKPKPRRVN